jgi:thiol-disulfide isomerase/thioredoxin
VSSQSANKNALGAGPRASARMDLSGHERDKFYLSRGARDVVELSYLSGADGVEDARAFAKADLDRDGFEDLIVVNRNAPLLRVYRNQLGPSTKRHFLGVRVEGARQRDAVGARVTARGCGVTQTREVAIGAGFATVNAMALTLGLDRCARLDELSVQFPRGERRTFKNVAADSFYRVVEGKGLQALPGVYGARTTAPAAPPARGRIAELAARMPGKAPLVLVDLFASWCEACARTKPRLDALVAATSGGVDLLRVTVEPKDPGYDERAAREIEALFGGAPPLPSTLVVDRKSGAVMLQTRGLPTRSELERVRWQRR